MVHDVLEDNSLVLAAEDFNIEDFESYHYFTKHDLRCISKLKAHGPVLLKGARGSGKSALMIKASLELFPHDVNSNTLGIYLSLRHLELLRSKGDKYEALLCNLISKAVNSSLKDHQTYIETNICTTGSLQIELTELASILQKRIVILFDDAAHIGRETSLNEFFDMFRTLSNSVISCKASIYPGVTQFGTRFDVYNDATVIDVVRSESSLDFSEIFVEVMTKRFSKSLPDKTFINGFNRTDVATFLGKAVLGNMRAYMFSCHALITDLKGSDKVSLSNLSETLKNLAQNYYWPLIEEIEPKLGIYEPMVEPSLKLAEILFEKAGTKSERTVIILREINQRLSKLFEILEYTGFISRREASRAMKSRGRGTRYALNLCNILEYIPGSRITNEIYEKWLKSQDESIEYHKGSELYTLENPEPDVALELKILGEDINILEKSNIYPYGLTKHKIELFSRNNFATIEQLLNATDEQLLDIEGVGVETVKRLRSTLNQAIWM